MSTDEDKIQERIAEMREEELVNFIRVDVIPQLESLASRLEQYMENNQGQGPYGGSTTISGNPEAPHHSSSHERDDTQGLSEER